MSWSVSAVGKPKPAAAKLAADFAKITYCSAEETAVKDSAAACVAAALEAHTDPKSVVRVYASGSESTDTIGDVKHRRQSLKIEIEPIHGFIGDTPAA